MAESETRPSARAAMDNWRQPLPFFTKLRTGFRNIATRFRGEQCCGRPGEPGC